MSDEPKINGEISFDQIQRFDKIRTVRECHDGFKIIFEGWADTLGVGFGSREWRSGFSERFLASEGFGGMADADTESITFYLMDRPEGGERD